MVVWWVVGGGSMVDGNATADPMMRENGKMKGVDAKGTLKRVDETER
jgi:hypothetical protein